MNTKKFSRRRFLGKSLCFSAIPLVFSPQSSFAADSNAINGFSLSPGVHDQERITSLLKEKEPLIWVFVGDSITHGALHTHGYRSYPEIFGERIRYEIGRPRDIVINTGISGNTTQSILSDFNWRIRQFKPDVVSLMIGTNDCATTRDISPDAFEYNLDSLLTMFRDMNSIPILHTPNIIIKEKAPERERLSEYVSITQNIAKSRDIILVDNYTFWQNAIKSLGETTINKNWLNDPLHPNGAGHSQIARLMFKELSIFDPLEPTCGAPYYEGLH